MSRRKTSSSTRRSSGAARRTQLIDVARTVFTQRGYEATSVEEVASHLAALSWMGLRHLPKRPELAIAPSH